MIWDFLLLEEKQASFCMKVYIVWFQINLCDKNWLRQVESLYFFRLWLYVYFVLSLIKLGTASSWLGVLGCCLRVKVINILWSRGFQSWTKIYFCHVTGLQIFVVCLVCCLKIKSVKDSFPYPCQEETWKPYSIIQSKIILHILKSIAAIEIDFSCCAMTQFGHLKFN